MGERVANDQITKFKAEIAELAAKIEQGAGMSIEQENQLQQLRTQKEQLEKDRDMLKQNTEMLQKICVGRESEVRKLEHARNVSEEQIADIKVSLDNKRSEIEAEKRRKEELELQMKNLRVENELHQEEHTSVQ